MAKHFEDTEVDVVSFTNTSDVGSLKSEDSDATEYSSSFANTDSDSENSSGSSDGEAESELFGEKNYLECRYDPYNPDVRRSNKKVTEHWRNYIRPLMLRLKWTELKLKQLESQEIKYSRELYLEDHWAKHKVPANFNLEESGSRSVPFSSHQYRSKVKMRRKRKKVEDTTDVASYTANHFLFSNLENKKKSGVDGKQVETSAS